MGAGVSFEVPEFYCSIVRAADHNFFGVLDELGDVRGVLCGKVSNEVAIGDVPHFNGFVEACAEEGDVVVEEDDGPDEVKMAGHCFKAG